jgi:hypothetical protein
VPLLLFFPAQDYRIGYFKPLNTTTMAIVKVIEVLSESATSWEDAAQQAVTEAGKTLHNIRSVYIKEQTAKVENNKVTAYRITAKISFELDQARGD